MATLPPYSEMIFAAIDALKEKEGCSESTISNYIQSTISYLPEDHSNILTQNLNKLVKTNHLVLTNNNYSRSEASASVKRGRGRPLKAKNGAQAIPEPRKEPEPAAQVASAPGSEVKRGRGRPKKDPNAPPAVKKVKMAAAVSPASKSGRGRGRPRKVQPELTGVEAN